MIFMFVCFPLFNNNDNRWKIGAPKWRMKNFDVSILYFFSSLSHTHYYSEKNFKKKKNWIISEFIGYECDDDDDHNHQTRKKTETFTNKMKKKWWIYLFRRLSPLLWMDFFFCFALVAFFLIRRSREGKDNQTEFFF